jgi:MoxR-like ATPase
VRCCLHGRLTPSVEDIRHVALQALRHRVILNFEGEAEGISTDDCLRQAIESVSADG